MPGPFDVLVLAVLAVGYVLGRAKGFAWQVSGIATLALGFVAATVGSRAVAGFFPDAWPLDARRFAGWTAIYALVSIAIYVVTLGLSKKLKDLQLDDLDRRFGGTLGAVKAGLGLAAVSVVLVAGSEQALGFVQASVSGRLLARVGMLARPLLPDRIGSALERSLQRIDPEATATGDPAPARPAPLPPAPPTTGPAPQRPPLGAARPPRPRQCLAPRLDESTKPAPRPAPTPAPSTTPDDSMGGDDDEAPSKPDSGKTIEPEPEASPSPEPLDPLAPPRTRTNGTKSSR
jgi:uncharacterized membrane protein required for colicin V production